MKFILEILKSSCKIEKLQLETRVHFDTCLELYMIIAWRILYLTMLGRQCLEASSNIDFSQEEWEVAYMMKHKESPPESPISLSDMLNLIGQFGGYINRKRDSMPGPTTIWIGLQRLRDFIKARIVFDEINVKTDG